MCWMCDRPGATERDYPDHMRQLITTYGWAVQGVERDGIHPPWAYTVGLTAHRRPELVVTGMPISRATGVLNGVAAHLLHADRARAGHAGGAARRPARRGGQGRGAIGALEDGDRALRRPDPRPAARARRRARELALGQPVPGRSRGQPVLGTPGAARAPQAGRLGRRNGRPACFPPG